MSETSATSATSAATSSFCGNSAVFYGSEALYVCGGSAVIGALRTGNAFFRLFQLSLISREDNDAFETTLSNNQSHVDVVNSDKCTMYKKPDAMKKFYLWEIARGISEIILPVISALYWVYKDHSYERPSDLPADLATNPENNLFGWDELKVLNTGVAALRSVQKTLIHTQEVKSQPLL